MSDEPDLSLVSREEWLNRHKLFKLYPDTLWPPLLKPCRVRILMVLDGGGSFGTADFGLKALLDALAVPPGPWVRFEIVTAHRRSDPTADLENFAFDGADLGDFDQIWLFGVERRDAPGLSDSELRGLSEFMDGGGGVFATGDHEDLGVAMCGRVPRVRSMRKWHWPNPGPNGEPVAPPVGGPDRLDTLRSGPSPGIQFNDQSDDVPQTISPQMYPKWRLPWRLLWRFHPHPVLCGPRGVIKVLPDHPHEGECYVPTDLGASFSFDGYTIEEYPAMASGNRLSPEVIATSTVIGGRQAGDVKGPVTPRNFGAIGVWDGHQVSRGRVLVDATWHHFFNINLVGEPAAFEPEKRLGFLASPQGEAAYEEIKSYYRNIAVWLARPAAQSCMRARAFWAARWHHRLLMDMSPDYIARGIETIEHAELLRIGEVARDVIGQLAPWCQVTTWGLELVRELDPAPWELLGPLIDPWHPLPPGPQPDPAPWVHANMLVDTALGSTMYALGAEFPTPGPDSVAKAEKLDWDELLRPGVDAAMRRTRDALEESGRAAGDFAQALRAEGGGDAYERA